MNAERILKLADVIEAAPHEMYRSGSDDSLLCGFNMGKWHCGSVGCIGGWAHQLFVQKSTADYDGGERARIALGLTPSVASELFLPTNTRLDDILPSQAAAVLRNLAATGKVNWSVQS